MTRNRVCRWVTVAFLALYAAALLLLAFGTFGWLGVERDPLAAVYLLPLGLPWNRFLDAFPAAWLPWLAAAAPLVNVVLLFAVCRAVNRRSAA